MKLAVASAVVGIGIAGAAAALPASASPVGRSVTTVNIVEKEFKTIASTGTVKAGPVTFVVRNTGTVAHELVVLRTVGARGFPVHKNYRISEATWVGETGDIEAGKQKSVTLNLKPGSYQLVCNLPGHYQLGMHVLLTVK